MRILNNQKRMVTTHILGLFLTAALPVSLSLIATPFANATEKESLSPLQEDKSLQTGINRILNSQKEIIEKVPQKIALNVEGKTSQNNLGNAQHGLQNSLVKRQESEFLNKLLPDLAKNDLNLQDNIAIVVGTKIYNLFYFTAEGIANGTYKIQTESINDLALNLDVALRLYDVMKISLAYQNLFHDILKTHEKEAMENKNKYQIEYDNLKLKLDEEETKLTEKYNEEKKILDNQVKSNEISKKQVEGAENKDKHSVMSYTKIIEGLNKSLNDIKNNFEVEKNKLSLQLVEKKSSDDLLIEKLVKSHKDVEQKFSRELSLMFESLGTNYLVPKTLTRLLSWQPLSREKFNYGLFDLRLEKDKNPLVDAEYLLYTKILNAHQLNKLPTIRFSAEEILEGLLTHLGITTEVQETFGQRMRQENKALKEQEVLKNMEELKEQEVLKNKEESKEQEVLKNKEESKEIREESSKLIPLQSEIKISPIVNVQEVQTVLTSVETDKKLVNLTNDVTPTQQETTLVQEIATTSFQTLVQSNSNGTTLGRPTLEKKKRKNKK